MDKKPDSIVILSIKPEYAEAILSGEKKFEFRKTRFARDVSHVVIYATMPVGRVVGFFEVSQIEEKKPADIWKDYGSVGSISKHLFDDYFVGSEKGYAIGVKNAVRLSSKTSLTNISNLNRPPQSFAYAPSLSVQQLISGAA